MSELPDLVSDHAALASEEEPRAVKGAFVPALVGMTAGVLGVAAWAYTQLPAAVALTSFEPTPSTSVAAGLLDASSGVAVAQLTAAADRSLELIATQMTAQVKPSTAENPTVAGGTAGPDYSDTLAELEKAEQAAAQQLAMSKDEVAAARAEQKKAEAELASEEQAAAREVDEAISAAIAAAEAQTEAVESLPTAEELVDPSLVTALPSGNPVVAPPDDGGQLVGASTNTAAVLAMIRKYFPAGEVGNAMAIAGCESGRKNAVGALNSNGTRDYGIFQLNDGGTLQAALRRIGEPYNDISEARSKALESELNVRMARVLWDSRGWQPWVCAAKMKVVSGLYESTPGSMYGKYNDLGEAG
ncbi:MAG: hypothetical protein ACOYEV_01540 [Candidatus Nanopelagicales bacterium]